VPIYTRYLVVAVEALAAVRCCFPPTRSCFNSFPRSRWLSLRRAALAARRIIAGWASLFFYGPGGPVYLLLLIASVAVNFSLGLRMEDPLRRAHATVGVRSISRCLHFKYTNFIFDSINTLTGAPLRSSISCCRSHLVLHLPANCLSVDVMRGAKVEPTIVSYTLFVSFFPALIAGRWSITPR